VTSIWANGGDDDDDDDDNDDDDDDDDDDEMQFCGRPSEFRDISVDVTKYLFLLH